MHVLTPKEEIFKARTFGNSHKTSSPQNMIECGSYKPVSRPRIQKDINKSNCKDHFCQTNSHIYSSRIPKAVRAKREVATNVPDYRRRHHLPRTGNNSTETYSKGIPKSVSPEVIRKTGSPTHRQKSGSPHHLPGLRSPDYLRSRSPEKLYERRSRESVYTQRSRNKFGKSYEKIWPTNPDDARIRHSTTLRNANPGQSIYSQYTPPPDCDETFLNQQTKLHSCDEKICRPGHHEHTPRRQYSPNADNPGTCGLYGPCSPKRQQSPDHQENIIGDNKGQGGDGVQTLVSTKLLKSKLRIQN